MDNYQDDPTVEDYLVAFEEAVPVDLVGSPRVILEGEMAMPCAVAIRTDFSYGAITSSFTESIGNGLFAPYRGMLGTRGSAPATA